MNAIGLIKLVYLQYENILKLKVMKKLIFILLGLIIFSCTKENQNQQSECDCRSELFYYTSGEKEFLDSMLLSNYLTIGFIHSANNEEIISQINQHEIFKPITESNIFEQSEKYLYNIVFVQTKSDYTCSEMKRIIQMLEMNSLIAFANLTFKSTLWFGGEYADIMAITDEFMVKIKDINDLSGFYSVLKETNTTIKRDSLFGYKDVYMISANKYSKGDALQMSKYFYETGKFVWANPNFWDVGLGN